MKEKKMSEIIKQRLEDKNIKKLANENISDYICSDELNALKIEVEQNVSTLLNSLTFDTQNDHNIQGTSDRLTRMFINEIFSGRFLPQPDITVFPNTKELDELYIVGPIQVNSTCAHHFAPIIGKLWIGVIPGSILIGLSKFHRLVHWILSRPQIQEEAIVQIADKIESLIHPKGIGVIMKMTHTCTTLRGVKDSSSLMKTSVMRGVLKNNEKTRAEFLNII